MGPYLGSAGFVAVVVAATSVDFVLVYFFARYHLQLENIAQFQSGCPLRKASGSWFLVFYAFSFYFCFRIETGLRPGGHATKACGTLVGQQQFNIFRIVVRHVSVKVAPIKAQTAIDGRRSRWEGLSSYPLEQVSRAAGVRQPHGMELELRREEKDTVKTRGV